MRIRGIKGKFEEREKGLFLHFEILRKEEKEKTRERKKGEGEIARIQAKTNTILTKEERSCIAKSSHHQKHL